MSDLFLICSKCKFNWGNWDKIHPDVADWIFCPRCGMKGTLYLTDEVHGEDDNA